MLDQANFAFLILTGEDEQATGKFNPRLNVVHEAGLFQGRLGFEKAIILREEGCEDFSNVGGLGEIHFPKGDIGAKFESIRGALEREGIIGARASAGPRLSSGSSGHFQWPSKCRAGWISQRPSSLDPDFGLRGGRRRQRGAKEQPVRRLLEGTTRVLPGLLVGGVVAR